VPFVLIAERYASDSTALVPSSGNPGNRLPGHMLKAGGARPAGPILEEAIIRLRPAALGHIADGIMRPAIHTKRPRSAKN
jgi:hypothetical protein